MNLLKNYSKKIDQMYYYSTNKQAAKATLEEAVIKGLASDKGLFMPETIKRLPDAFYHNIGEMTFQEMSFIVAEAFFGEDVEADILKEIVYDTLNFDTPLVHVHDNIYSLELFHGPTLAFKDVGGRFMARLLGHFIRKKGEKEVNVLVATSGDTGSAVANGFLGVPGIRVFVLYPKGKVSEIQEKQFTTLGQNITALEVDGTFDDCQSLVKEAFMDKELNKALLLTSANSINVARFLPQSFYYFYAYAQLKRAGKADNAVICVPSGNFGNCLAGWFAKNMGLPVNKFIAASNKNNILTDFFTTGKYDANREFFKTNAPAMDILVSSNLERLVWYMSGKDGDKVKEYMEKLKADGIYEVDDETFARIQDQFKAGYLNEEEVLKTIKDCYEDNGYVLDTHTACGYGVLKQYQKETGDQTKTI